MRIASSSIAAALFALATCSGAAQAQTSAQPAAPPAPSPDVGMSGNRVTLALGVASLPDYEGADDNQITPGAAAIGTLGGYDFFTRGTNLYVDLVKDEGGPGTHFELGPVAGVRLQRNNLNAIDDRQVRALGKIDTAYNLGASVGVSHTGVITSEYDTITARVAYVGDVSGGAGSYVVTPQINYTTPLSIRTLVSLGASADYVGKGYGRTYFGVTPTGTLASGLRSYDIGDSGFKSYNISFFALQSLSGDLRRGLGIGAGVLYGRLLGKYKDSPLVSDVGSASQWAGAIGLTYTF
ncbi:MAG TPA: MipA/OmpV family protein [Sphingomonas sp.]|nr:MipA/OmpV family protein [Sphingomonas sp.]